MNKRGSSDSGCGVIGTTLIVAVVIVFRIVHELGPEYLTPSGIGKYLGEMALFAGAWAGCTAIGRSEKIKAPISTILIVLIIAVAAYLIYKLWRI